MLNEYKLSEKELKEMMAVDLEEDMTDTTKKQYILNLGFEYLIKEIFRLNDYLESRSQIKMRLDTDDKVYAFKWCQAKIISNLFNFKDVIIDDIITDTIRFEMRLSKVNGFQR